MEKPNKIDNLPREGDSVKASILQEEGEGGGADLLASSIYSFMTLTVLLGNIIHYDAIIPRSKNQEFISQHQQP